MGKEKLKLAHLRPESLVVSVRVRVRVRVRASITCRFCGYQCDSLNLFMLTVK